jgi:hypothetical protein
MALNCLRCSEQIRKFLWVTLDRPHDNEPGTYMELKRALVLCPACGNCEILSDESPLLQGLERIPTPSGHPAG